MPYIAVVCLLAMGALTPLFQQTAQPPVDRPALVAAAAKTLRERYVFLDVAERMAADLEAGQARREFDTLAPAPFAERLTERMQAISRDGHVRVRYSPPVPGQTSLPVLDPFPDFMNFGFYRVERLPGNIGYIDLRSFIFQPELPGMAAATMRLLERTDALVIDLRKNGGGQMQTQLLLASYFLPPTPVRWADTRPRGRPTVEWSTLAELDGPRYLNKPLVILTSRNTYSAAESFVYHLRRLRSVTLIGEVTGGGANPGVSVPLGGDFYMFVAIGQNVAPGTTENWEGKGVSPDVAVAADDALNAAQARLLGDLLPKTTEPRLRMERTIALEALQRTTKPSAPAGGREAADPRTRRRD